MFFEDKQKKSYDSICLDVTLWGILPILMLVISIALCAESSNDGYDRVLSGFAVVINLGILAYCYIVVLKYRQFVAIFISCVFGIPWIVIVAGVYFPLLFAVSTTVPLIFTYCIFMLMKYYSNCID